MTITTTKYLTAGCGANPPRYCPDDSVTREQAAVFIEKAMGVFTPLWPMSQRFNDVGEERFGYPFIDDFAARGFTTGCGSNPPLYCPNDLVTREQMALFLEKAVGRNNPPDPYVQRFVDVDPGAWSYKWIDSFVSHAMDRGIMDVIERGCNSDGVHYCPTQPVTRGEMAAFLAIAFRW
jgi:predicted small lipoprotein YifL